MAVLGFAGAEIGTTAELSNVSGIVADSALAHGGRYCFRVSVGGAGSLLFAERSTAIYFRGYVRYPAGLAATTRILEFRNGAGVAQLAIELRSDFILQVVGLSGPWVAGTTPLVADVWHRIEILLVQATQSIEVRLNRRQDILTTAAGIPALIGQVAIMSTSGNVYWDDLHVTEDGWPGPGFVIARQGRPGTPTFNDFTRTGGEIHAIWSDTPLNLTTSAVSTAASQTQTMPVELFSQVPIAAKYGAQKITARDVVLGARVFANGRRVGAGPDHYIVRAILDIVTRTGPTNFSSVDTYRGTEIFWASLAQLDAMEIGGARGEVTSTSQLVINDVWLVVSYVQMPVDTQHFTGFETGSLAEVTGVVGSVVLDPVLVRTGGYAAKGTGPAALFVMHPNPIEADNLWVRGYVYLPSLPTANEVVLSLRDANNAQVSARILTDGRMRLQMPSISINSVSPVFVVGAWNYVELYKCATVLPGDGLATLSVNDQQITAPIVETGGATIQAVWEVRSTAIALSFDDLAMSETGRIGQGRVIARQGFPGTPTYADWTKVGGSIDVVWDNTPTNAATYAQALAGKVLPQIQTMLVNPQANGGTYLSATDTIIACRIVAMARYDTGGGTAPSAVLSRVLRPGAAPLDTKTHVVITSTTSRLVYGDVFATLLASLDTLEIGGTYIPPSIDPVLNGGMENFTGSIPTSWSIFGAGAVSAQDTVNVHDGESSAALTRIGTNCVYFQDLVTAARPISWWIGHTVILTVWMQATVAGSAQASLDDNVTYASSPPHNGNGLFQSVTVSLTIGPTASRVLIQLYCLSDTTVRFDDISVAVSVALSSPGSESLMRIEDLWLMVMATDLQILDLPAPSTPAPVAIVEIEL